MSKGFVSLLLVLVVSCAGGKVVTSDRPVQVKEIKSDTQEKMTLIQETENGPLKLKLKAFGDIVVPNCEGCLIGSSTPDSIQRAEGEIYYLYGAEHLNLKNLEFDIPVVWNEHVQKWVNYFVGRGRHFFIQYTERGGRYAPLFAKILEEYKLPRDLIYLSMAESGFQNHAKSWAKAVGPWQFMRFTGRKYGLHVDNWFYDERRDPIKATHAAARYLRDLFDIFGGFELAASGYNAGEGKVGRAIRKYRTSNFWEIRKGKYLRSETKNYVPKIMALAIIGKNLESFGFTDLNFHMPLDYEEIAVPAFTDLHKVAKIVDMDFETLKKWNPELVRWLTPGGAPYTLRLPIGKKELWEAFGDKESVVASDFQKHPVSKKDSLEKIAKQYRVPSAVLAELNNITDTGSLNKNETIVLPFREGQDIKDPMYSDLYEKSKKGKKERKVWKTSLKAALRSGRLVSNPKYFYTVQKGDTLWDVSRKTGVSVDTIIRSNYDLIRKRSIVPGDKLAIR